LIIQNGNAYVEGIDNNFWEPIQVYWKDRGAINKGLDNDWWKNVKASQEQFGSRAHNERLQAQAGPNDQ